MEVRNAKDGEIQPVQEDVAHPVPRLVLVGIEHRPRPRILLNLKLPLEIDVGVHGTTFAFPLEAARDICLLLQAELRAAESA